MKQWNSDEELFALMKEKLYTPVVGDILDQMGYKHQFLPANIRPLEALVPADAYVDRSQPDNRLKVAGMPAQCWKMMYLKIRKSPLAI